MQYESNNLATDEIKQEVLVEAVLQTEQAWTILRNNGNARVKLDYLLSRSCALESRYHLHKQEYKNHHAAAIEKLAMDAKRHQGLRPVTLF